MLLDSTTPTCSEPDCQRFIYARAFCKKHYQRRRRNGLLPPLKLTSEDRFWMKVNKQGPLFDGTPCYLWTGVTDKYGYGFRRIAKRKTVKVHRWAYETFVAPIPEGLTIDHLCRVRNCVNTAHLEPVTLLENIERGATHRNPNRIHNQCIAGHFMDEENTYRNGKRRFCKECQRRRTREWMRKNRASTTLQGIGSQAPENNIEQDISVK